MSSKINEEEQLLDKNVESRDPTLDDDNKSDSDEYEYEEIEVEYEEISSDIEPLRVTISEVETITPKEENVKQKTLILKSDGTTEKLEKDKKKSKVGRMLTSQEESILLPLIQGLLASGSNESTESSQKSKHENTPFPEKEHTISPKNEDTDDTCQGDATKRAQGTNILEELLTALNRLQTTIVEEKEVVGDTRKRNTILTLVAWLKRILQTSTNDSSAVSTETQLTDLLPTELLLTKLMPQLSNDISIYNKSTTNDNEPSDARLPASSKRFSRQRNNRFNTIGVSKEELADARLYLQKKLLSENLASTATKASVEIDKQQNIFEEREDDRRRSLNFLQSTKLDKGITDLLNNVKSDPNQNTIADGTKGSTTASMKIEMSKDDREPSIQSRSKVITRRKSSSNVHPIHGQLGSSDQNPTTDTDDEQTSDAQRKYSNGNVGTSSKSMNKFALRKLKMKRANTIDIPKNSKIEDIELEHDRLNKNSNNNMETTLDESNRLIRNNHVNEIAKNNLPEFKIKSSHDKKFQDFLNRKNEVTHSTWINPNKSLNQNSKENSRSNWISKFGSIKNSFENASANVSPQLSKKNSFTHAPTSPFKPVQNNKPPQIPNGSYSYHNNNQQVLRKVAAIQSNEHNEPTITNSRPQLRTHQSLPNYANMQNKWNPELNAHNTKLNEWQQNKPTSVDSHILMNSCSPRMMSSSYNPLYVPLNKGLQNENQPSPSQAILPIDTSANEFPSYTYTCTDYTQPTCVSTFGPEKAPIQIKNTILPDTSYLKKQSPAPTPPSLGSAALNMQMKTFDMHSSSEYLSEPTNYSNYFRSPQPFSPTCMNNYDSQPESYEYTAKSHIMQYPQTQTATVINKAKRFDQHNSFHNLNSIVPSSIHDGRNYSYNDLNSSPFSETGLSQINQTYVPPEEISQNRVPKQVNKVGSMEHSPTKYESMPIRLRNNTSHYGSHAALTTNQGNQINEFIAKETVPKMASVDNNQSKVAAPVKLNSYGGQYIQPKVETNFDKSFPKFGKGSVNNNVRNNTSNVNRSQFNSHHRLSEMEIKRKQSLPAQGSDYFDTVCNQNQSDLPPTHRYLPSGVLKRSKSTHTLALLQQFENKGKSHDNEQKATLPSYVRKPSFDSQTNDAKQSSLNTNKIDFENKSKLISSRQEALPKREFDEISAMSKTRTDFSASSRKTLLSGQITKNETSSINNKIETKESFLNAPTMSEIPSPSVEDGHIIYPGQTTQTKNRVQHYAQTLNAILNRKSIILDEDDTDSDKNDATSDKNQILQKSKSGSLLSVPKQYESAIKKSEVDEKQRTVAAYFLANKSPSQNLQRSSSQHSVLSSSSFKSARDNSNATSPHHLDELEKSAESTEMNASRSTSSTTTTTTTTNKSAHHLKILRRQQKTTFNTPLAKSQTLPSINLLDESNVDDAFEDLFASFNAKV